MRSENARATWYRGNRSSLGSVAIGLTAYELGRFRPLLVVDWSGTIGSGDETADCRLAPNGSCEEYFPGLSGVSAGAGLRARVSGRIDLDIVGGLGSMSGRSRYVGTHVAIGLTRHTRAVGGVRQIYIQHSSGETLKWRPVFFGLRIQ